jgi:hypothetical protein
MQREAAILRGAVLELMTTFGIVKVIKCRDSRMESEQHHGSMAKLIV